MKTEVHKANSRGHANHGWLNTYHSFSFAGYHNPDRMNFGVLRVLNDDEVAPGMGFSTHAHHNMEIISIPLEGDLEHKDSMGNTTVIRQGDIQAMSAGTGVQHSEKNRSKDSKVKFLQIWIIPKKPNTDPKYDQISLDMANLKNRFQQILSPFPHDDGVWIHQDAWFYLGAFQGEMVIDHKLNLASNGVYIFVLEGQCAINGNVLERRDGCAIRETESIRIKIGDFADLLLMEVPLSN